jgi:hypothetical protein
VLCKAANCTASECCITAPLCTSFTACPANQVLRKDAKSVRCASAACNGSECCTAGTTTCTSNGLTYPPGDWICDNGVNSQCVGTAFVSKGQCVDPELIDCTKLGVTCSSAWSSSLGESLVYCGESSGFQSAKSLCYTDAFHYCDNNHLGTGQDWLIRDVIGNDVGIPCPAN